VEASTCTSTSALPRSTTVASSVRPLAAEVGPLGIRVVVVEPGAFRTAFSGPSLVQSARIADYDDTVGPTREMITGLAGVQPGDPALAAAAILAALDAERPPLRLPLGADAVDGILGHLESVRAEVREWQDVARATAFPPVAEPASQ